MAGPEFPSTDVLTALGLGDASLERFPTGLINTSWLVVVPGGERRVLQCVNSMFPPEVNADIDAVTRHLESRGLITPRLIPMPNGKPYFQTEDAVWRQLTYIAGNTYDAVQNAHQADEAGALLARFHRAMGELEHTFVNPRSGAHDTARHIAHLSTTLEQCKDHSQITPVQALADEVFELVNGLPDLGDVPDRLAHGDPKISNIVFAEGTNEALCLIDLDTLGRMPIVLDLGDAFRSWCNPLDEDEPGAEFSLLSFHSAIGGYARATEGFLNDNEWRKIPAATLTITVELATRFCADALNESYFAWNPDRFRSASEHNQARTRSQINLAHSIVAQREQLETEVMAAFGTREIRGRPVTRP